MTDSPPARLAATLAEIAAASRGRDVTLVVITKFHPVSLVRDLAAAGHRDFGENRHPESRDKAESTAELGLTWHFVGQLQRNKVRQVARYAQVLHSIDRVELVESLEGGDPGEPKMRRDAFMQVNLTDDPRRGGVAEAGAEALAERMSASDALRLVGVMAVAPIGEDPASAFARLGRISERVQTVNPAASNISAGMSADWRVALDYGATHLRIGSTITGNRPERG